MNKQMIKVAITGSLSIILGAVTTGIIYWLTVFFLKADSRYAECFRPINLNGLRDNFACYPTPLKTLDIFSLIIALFFILGWYLILNRVVGKILK